MLKFLVDHNVPHSVSVFLRKEKHNVKLVKDINPTMTDLQVMGWARKEKRIVLSNDKDFLGLSVKFSDVDMIFFDYRDQKPEVRIKGLKQILPHLEEGFGIAVLQ